MSATVKLAKVICEFPDIGRLTAEYQLVWLSSGKLATREMSPSFHEAREGDRRVCVPRAMLSLPGLS